MKNNVIEPPSICISSPLLIADQSLTRKRIAMAQHALLADRRGLQDNACTRVMYNSMYLAMRSINRTYLPSIIIEV